MRGVEGEVGGRGGGRHGENVNWERQNIYSVN